MVSVLDNCQENELRTNRDQSETRGEFRGSFESQPDPFGIDWDGMNKARLERAIGDPPRYGACAYTRAVIGDTKQSWDQLGWTAIQGYRNGKSYVYFIGGDEGLIKIGMSIAPLERITALQMGSPIELRFLALIEGGLSLERSYHARFAAIRARGEWFERAPELLTEIARIRGMVAA